VKMDSESPALEAPIVLIYFILFHFHTADATDSLPFPKMQLQIVALISFVASLAVAAPAPVAEALEDPPAFVFNQGAFPTPCGKFFDPLPGNSNVCSGDTSFCCPPGSGCFVIDAVSYPCRSSRVIFSLSQTLKSLKSNVLFLSSRRDEIDEIVVLS
jgi:hypothetical protein